MSNSLDVAHLAEEIEDLGRRDVREVESLSRVMLERLLEVVFQPADQSARHWRAEIVNFQDDAQNAFTNSMHRKMDVDRLWQVAARSFMESSSDSERLQAADLPLRSRQSPLTLDELLVGPFDLDRAVQKLSQAPN